MKQVKPVLLFSLCVFINSVRSDPPGANWTLTFSDEFNGTALDGSKWSKGYGWGVTTGWTNEWIDPDNVLVEEGRLRLKLENRPGTGKLYASGAVNTRNKFTQEYGYLEARMKMPAGSGFLSAFWGKRNDESWPPEIDVIEVIGPDPGRAFMTVHWDDGGHQSSGGNWAGPDFSADFHVFGFWWGPDENVWYIDGVERRRTSNGASRINGDFYFMFNTHIGGNPWMGDPDGSTPWPSYNEIDWVRIYKEGGTPAISVRRGDIPDGVVMAVTHPMTLDGKVVPVVCKKPPALLLTVVTPQVRLLLQPSSK